MNPPISGKAQFHRSAPLQLNPKISAEHLQRRAVIYVRQSTPKQVLQNRESQKRQYGLAERAAEIGFARVETIDDDLGLTGSGLQKRPGFQRLMAEVCTGELGAVFCLEASRLARNGTDWHYLLEMCRVAQTLVIDEEGVYDPRLSNDRLLLGLKGTMSEYELSLFRQRALEARQQKAQRGEMRCNLPAGYQWVKGGGGERMEKDPDVRVQHAVEAVLNKFAELGSVRQLLFYYLRQDLTIPAIKSSVFGRKLEWAVPTYTGLLSMVSNPVYAGAYVFGKTETRVKLEDGRARKSTGNRKPRGQWTILIRDHHAGYISWEQYERNQQRLRENSHQQAASSRRSGRGGEALLTGLLRCGHCGCMMYTFYPQKRTVRYKCRRTIKEPDQHCQSFAGRQADEQVAAAMLRAVEPGAIETAMAAMARQGKEEEQRNRAMELELEQARYDEQLAAQRYEEVDPRHRLVADQLEARWNEALGRVKDLESKREQVRQAQASMRRIEPERLLQLAADLPRVWEQCNDMRLKQRIARILMEEVVAKVQAETNEVVLTVHWAGGQHSEIRIEKPNRKVAADAAGQSAEEIVRRMAEHFPDTLIAATLNRNGLRNNSGKRWRLAEVHQLRKEQGLPDYDEAAVKRQLLTARQAAERLQVDIGTVRRLIAENLLPGQQVVKFAPWRIAEVSLELPGVVARIRAIHERIKQAVRGSIDMPFLPGLEAARAENEGTAV